MHFFPGTIYTATTSLAIRWTFSIVNTRFF